MSEFWRLASSAVALLTVAVGVIWYFAALDSEVRANSSWRAQNADLPAMVQRIDERTKLILDQVTRLSERLPR